MSAIPELVKIYQCPGCVSSPEDSDCYRKSSEHSNNACDNHCPGTLAVNIGKLMLGFPKGFDRVGFASKVFICIFDKFEDGWDYDKFNIPVWKYYDTENDTTLVKGLSPRICMIFIHIYAGDARDKIDCLELTKDDIEEMD